MKNKIYIIKKLYKITKPCIAIIIISIMIATLTGCGFVINERESTANLPSITNAPDAPVSDSRDSEFVPVTLFVPSPSFDRLTETQYNVAAVQGGDIATEVVAALFEVISPIFDELNGATLTLCDKVTTASGIVTVDVDVSMRMLSPRAQYALRASIATTLLGLRGVERVCVLTTGREDGADVVSIVPYGLMNWIVSSDLVSQWAAVESRVSMYSETTQTYECAIYYVPKGVSRVVPEPRGVSFETDDESAMLAALVDDMRQLASVKGGDAVAVVPPDEFMSTAPKITTQTTGAKVAQIYFRPEIDDYLAQNGGTRDELYAALTYTVTGFVPGIDGLTIFIGGSPVTEHVAQGGERLTFQSGIMTRDHFKQMDSSTVNIWLPSADIEANPIEKHVIAVSPADADDPRFLLTTVFEGLSVKRGDARFINDMSLDSGDIIAISLIDGEARVNLSERLTNAALELDESATRAFVFSIVNTLTELRGITRVRFYANGDHIEFLNAPYSSLGMFHRLPEVY